MPSLIILSLVSACTCHKESTLLWLQVKNKSYLNLCSDYLMTWLHHMFDGDYILYSPPDQIRLPVRSLSYLLSGEMALPGLPASLHHLHHGGSFPATPGHHALPLHPHRHWAVDPEEGGWFLGPQHHEPQRDQQDLQVGLLPISFRCSVFPPCLSVTD